MDEDILKLNGERKLAPVQSPSRQTVVLPVQGRETLYGVRSIPTLPASVHRPPSEAEAAMGRGRAGAGYEKGATDPIPQGWRQSCTCQVAVHVLVPTDFTYKTKSKIILLRISECWLHSIKTQGWGSVCTLAGRLQSAEVCPSAVGSGVLGPWPVHQEDWFLHPWSAHSSVGPAASRTELSMILFSWEKNYRNKITDF